MLTSCASNEVVQKVEIKHIINNPLLPSEVSLIGDDTGDSNGENNDNNQNDIIMEETSMNEQKLWEIINMLDWNKEGDDEAVLAPAIQFLSKLSNEEIYEFEEIMSKLLYDIDGKKWAKSYLGYYSPDAFLYSRCVAIVNGKNYYYQIKNGTDKLNNDLEFEAILYAPEMAWQIKNSNTENNEYPLITKYSYETGSNEINW